MKKVLVSILVILLLAGGSSFLVNENGNNSSLYQAGDMVVEPYSDEEDYPRV